MIRFKCGRLKPTAQLYGGEKIPPKILLVILFIFRLPKLVVSFLLHGVSSPWRVFVYVFLLAGAAGNGLRAPRLRSVEQDQGMPHDRQGYDRRGFAGVFVGWSGLAEYGGGKLFIFGCASRVSHLLFLATSAAISSSPSCGI